ncbi:MAG: chromate efflux transporter [candidate division WOR-3 bacterium]
MPRVSLRELAGVFVKVGLVGFGGGVGMLALIRRDVVEERKWITDEQLATGVALGQMLPGPFVTNYAEFIGYELRGLKGMTVAAVALLGPCFVLLLLLSWLYFRFGSMPLIARLFAGIQPVVVGILAWATWSISRTNIRSWQALLIGLASALALLMRGDVMLVVLGAGMAGIVLSGAWRQNARLSAVGLWLGMSSGLAVPLVMARAGELAMVFLKVGTVVFGGGFAAIPFLQHEVVDLRGWLTMKEFIDCVALGQLTPGPVAIMGAFIGYKVLGLAGAFIATLGTFLPSALMLLGLLQVYARIREHALVKGFLTGVLPAVCGLLLGATVSVGRSALTGLPQLVVALLSLALLLRFRLNPAWLVLGGALLGLVLP